MRVFALSVFAIVVIAAGLALYMLHGARHSVSTGLASCHGAAEI